MSPSGSGRPHLSVVIPAYNEEERLAESLPRIDRYLDQAQLDAEVVVVDDGSRDKTAECARRSLRGRPVRVLRNPENRGKGHAFRRGALEARGRWVLLTDADLSTPIEEYDNLATAVRQRDLDAAIGSRALPQSRVEQRQRRIREMLGQTGNRAMRWITGLPFRDTQCGFKLFDSQRIRPLLERMVIDGFAFDVELLFLCHRFGLRVEEVPVTWRNDAVTRVNLLTAPPVFLFDLLRVRWNFRRGLYHPGETGTAPASSRRSR